MRVYGNPNESIHTTKRLAGRIRRYHLMTFNEEGYADIDEKMLKSKTVEKIKKRFKTEEIEMHKCKQCNFETENKGKLLAHIRKEHKKEG